MTITIEIKGTKKEIEAYFKTKLSNKKYREVLEKQISKQMKVDIDLSSMQSESSLCFRDESRYTLSFQRLGACQSSKRKII
jgi:hypothetical protein